MGGGGGTGQGATTGGSTEGGGTGQGVTPVEVGVGLSEQLQLFDGEGAGDTGDTVGMHWLDKHVC